MLPAQIEPLLELDTDNVALAQRLAELARQDESAFRAVDWIWAVPLYGRDPFFFERFILSYISTPAVIDDVLRLAEQAQHQTLFSELWRHVASRYPWNDEIVDLLKTAPDIDRVEWRIRARSSQSAVAAGATLIMLYEYKSGALGKVFWERLGPGIGRRLSDLPCGRGAL